jgi:PAS domain S-box-containing protein
MFLSTDNPIIYASEGFSKFTGYSKEEIEGRNCRFLQGKDSNPEDVSRIREAIEKKEEVSVCLLNYRKDGSTFHNQVIFFTCIKIISRMRNEHHLIRSCFLSSSFSSLPSMVMMEPLPTT